MKTIATIIHHKNFPLLILAYYFTYFESEKGYWNKRQYDDSGKLIYFENHEGTIADKRE